MPRPAADDALKPQEPRLGRVREPQETWRSLALVGVALFVMGALAFALRPGLLDAADAWLLGAGGQAGILAAHGFAFLGSLGFVGAALVIACAFLARSGRIAAAVALVGIFLLQEAAVQALKHLVARPRPEWALLAAPGWSFPSGHAARGVLLAAMAIVLALPARKPLLVAGAAAFGLLMALSRVILGVHHVSDVVAGAGIGLATAALGIRMLLAHEARATIDVPLDEPARVEA